MPRHEPHCSVVDKDAPAGHPDCTCRDPLPDHGRPPSRPATAAILGMAAALAPPSPARDAIPAGYVCAACGAEGRHADGCRPPRGLRKRSP